MADLGMNLDFNDLPEQEERKEFVLLPPGDYVVTIDEATVKETNKKNGKYINLKCKVSQGEYINKFVFGMIIFQHENEDAQRIGLSNLRIIFEQNNITSISDDSQLVGATIGVTVAHSTYQGNVSAKIKYYKKISDCKAPKPIKKKEDVNVTFDLDDDIPF